MPRFVAMLLALAIPASLVDADPPGKLLDLSNWKLTLPIDADDSGGADEIVSPELKTFVDPRYFFINDAGDGVVFRAHCGGATTKGSKFPRSELREMTDRGREDADWSTAGETLHTMTMRVAITKTPAKKKHVVCAQIHDAQDDLIMIRLEGTKLFVERNALDRVMLERKYQLGTPFELKIQAGGGRVKVWYEEELKMDWQVSKSGCYFKAGCYTQSNPSKGDADDAYGEVVIYRLQVREM